MNEFLLAFNLLGVIVNTININNATHPRKATLFIFFCFANLMASVLCLGNLLGH